MTLNPQSKLSQCSQLLQYRRHHHQPDHQTIFIQLHFGMVPVHLRRYIPAGTCLWASCPSIPPLYSPPRPEDPTFRNSASRPTKGMTVMWSMGCQQWYQYMYCREEEEGVRGGGVLVRVLDGGKGQIRNS